MSTMNEVFAIILTLKKLTRENMLTSQLIHTSYWFIIHIYIINPQNIYFYKIHIKYFLYVITDKSNY